MIHEIYDTQKGKFVNMFEIMIYEIQDTKRRKFGNMLVKL